MNLDLKRVQDEITQLMRAYPQLADDEVLREDMFEGSSSLDEFIRELLRKIGSVENLRDSLSLYIEQLQGRKVRMQHSVEALRALIFKIMQHADLKTRALPEATISIRKTPAKVVIVDEQQIPEDF